MAMTVEEIARHVQFTVDQDGKTTAVVLTLELWRQLLDALEDAEDRALVRQLKERLATGPAASGALRWEYVSKDWA
jgi:PHD/YefM family antitoxin component YafN of YafNO toxin-antitoxin module